MKKSIFLLLVSSFLTQSMDKKDFCIIVEDRKSGQIDTFESFMKFKPSESANPLRVSDRVVCQSITSGLYAEKESPHYLQKKISSIRKENPDLYKKLVLYSYYKASIDQQEKEKLRKRNTFNLDEIKNEVKKTIHEAVVEELQEKSNRVKEERYNKLKAIVGGIGGVVCTSIIGPLLTIYLQECPTSETNSTSL